MTRIISVAVAAVTVGACTSGTTAPNPPTASTVAAGSPWIGNFVPAALPAPVNALTDVACASSFRCWAVGSTTGGSGAPNGAALVTTADGGASWTTQTIPSTVAYLSAIACSDQRRCIAVGQAAQSPNGQAASIATSDGGTSWTPLEAPAGILDLTAVTCRPDRRCVAVGTTAEGSTALMATLPASGWTEQGPLPTGISGATAISCTDDRTCWVTGRSPIDADHVKGTVAVSADGGATWALEVMPTGLGSLNGVSCLPGPTTGSGALPAPSGPIAAPPIAAPPTTSPPTTSPPTSTTAPAPIIGVAGARCTVVGTSATVLNSARAGHGILLTTDNGGATWKNRPVPETTAALTDISCTGLATCVAVGSTVASVPAAGVIMVSGSVAGPWRSAPSVSGPLPLSAVSCVSVSSCVAVGESISEHLSGG